MKFWRFTVYTLLGCIPWVLMLTLIGKAAGDNWVKWKDHLHYADYVVLVLLAALVTFLVIRRRRRRAATTT